MCAGSKAEVEQLVTDYLGDDSRVRALVDNFLSSRPAATAPTSSNLSSGTMVGGAAAGAGHEVSSRDANGVKESGLQTTGGQTLVDMRAQQVRDAASSRLALAVLTAALHGVRRPTQWAVDQVRA